MEKSNLPVITSEGFRGLYSRHEFTQAEKGAREELNAAITEEIAALTKQGMLQADHEGHSGLNRKHAHKAIEMVPEIPNGIY